MTASFDVVGIGNALVDVIADASDALIDELGLDKGAMRLVETTDEADALYERMGPGVELSGGSAANTVVGVASLGGRSAFIGRVRDDQLGSVFGHDIRAAGVHFATSAAVDGPSTGRCLILVTPDAERTMNTYLGASTDLHPGDLDPAVVEQAAFTYLEGYLFDPDDAKEAFRAAASLATAAGRNVALSLSDRFCVDRHRSDFVDLLDDVDVLFANDEEVLALAETDDLDDAIGFVAERCRFAAITRGASGSTVVDAGERTDVGIFPVEHVVDTTGAGDLYAAGFLFGLTRGASPTRCAELGALAAAEVVSHTGGRPARPLSVLAERHELV